MNGASCLTDSTPADARGLLMLDAIDPDFAPALSGRALTGLEHTLRDVLDAYDALGIEPDSLVPESVLHW